MRPCGNGHFDDKHGGLNGSTQHSARTHLALKTELKTLAGLDQPERYPGSAVKQIGSPGKAWSNQRVGWCCIDRLSWQPSPDKYLGQSQRYGTRRKRGFFPTNRKYCQQVFDNPAEPRFIRALAFLMWSTYGLKQFSLGCDLGFHFLGNLLRTL
jgi:hypothetical protein